MLNALWFWMGAHNRHGIHSPFIYGFLEGTLYARRRRGCNSQQQLLLAACEHFDPKNIGFAPPAAALADWLRPRLPEARWGSPPYDLFIAESPGAELESLLSESGLWHEESVIFVGGLRKSPGAREAWRRLCALPRLRVTLETYRAGLLFFRPQQAPQHFKIRLKSPIFRRS